MCVESFMVDYNFETFHVCVWIPFVEGIKRRRGGRSEGRHSRKN